VIEIASYVVACGGQALFKARTVCAFSSSATRLAADVHGRRHLSLVQVVWAMAAAEAIVGWLRAG
jgi:hypothetical protein